MGVGGCKSLFIFFWLLPSIGKLVLFVTQYNYYLVVMNGSCSIDSCVQLDIHLIYQFLSYIWLARIMRALR